MSRLFTCLAAVLFMGSAGSAQTVPGAPGAAQPGVSRQAAPPRDSAVKAAGTAVLRGRVFAADTGQPLRKAQVRLIAIGQGLGGSTGPQGRMTSTDAEGRYEFKELPSGYYQISTAKGRYVGLSYGQRRPNEPGRPLQILDGQTVEKVDFSLQRGGVIAGHILDEFGEPAEDVSVAVLRSMPVGGRRRLVNVGRNAMTNDNGEFRLFGLDPGAYYVSATLRTQMGPFNVESDDRSGYAPTYYPGTVSLGEAKRVTVGAGQTVNDIDVTLVSARLARISGTAVDSQGRPLASAFVMVATHGDGMLVGSVNSSANVRPDGGFSVSGLPPGDYTLTANVRGAPGEVSESAKTQVTLSGRDVDGVQIVGVKPSALTGRIVLADPSAARTLPLNQLRLAAQPMNPDDFSNGASSGRVNDDLTFEIKTPPGLISVATASPLPGWIINAVRVNGNDAIDSGINVRPNEDVGGIEIELTNRLSNLSGVVTNGRGETLADCLVAIFPVDRERWVGSARYRRAARPGQDGRFAVTGLPASEYYAFAVDSIDPSDATDPEYLERASRLATRFSLGDAEIKTLDLRLATGL